MAGSDNVKQKRIITLAVGLLLVSVLMFAILKNRNNTVETVDYHTKKITKEEFLETLKEEYNLSSKQAEIELEKFSAKNADKKIESHYYEMVDKILLTNDIYLVGVIRAQVFVDSNQKLLGFGKVVMKDLLIEGATFYQTDGNGTENDFESVIRQPQKTLTYVDILSGVQFYTEKILDSGKIENIGENKGQNLYRYIVDETFTYALEELENKK